MNKYFLFFTSLIIVTLSVILIGTGYHYGKEILQYKVKLTKCNNKLTFYESILSENLKSNYAGRFIATAYIKENGGKWNDGKSAKLYPVGYGMVAADWKVFPPGTVLFIEDYGYGIVLDKGGAIKGGRLDLYFETKKEAMKWGKHQIRVWVLGRIYVSSNHGKLIARMFSPTFP